MAGCLMSGAFLGAIAGGICCLFVLSVVAQFWDFTFLEIGWKGINVGYDLVVLSIIAGAVIGGILGSNAANYRRIAIVLTVIASVVAVPVVFFVSHMP